MEYGTLRVAARAALCKFLGKSDRGRWIDASKFDLEWNERSRLIASLIPAGSHALDLGAGRQQLRSEIGPNVRYTASDIVARDVDTLVIDLNARPLPDLTSFGFDVAVLAGVLEYISHVPSLAEWLKRNFSLCIVSYGCARELRGLASLRQQWDRMSSGWVNSFSEMEIRTLFALAGFGLIRVIDWETPDGNERIFLFRAGDASERGCQNG